jgi:Tol biopolymer transport system component
VRITIKVLALGLAGATAAAVASSGIAGRAAPSSRAVATVAVCSTPSSELAFTAQNRIDVVGVDGKGLVRITRPPTGFADSQPAWSPDGSRIAFVRSGRRKFHTISDIYVVGARGGRPRRLTRTTAAAQPLWSPAGTQISFGSGGGSFVVAAAGGKAKRLTQRSILLAWSPDGRRLASPSIGKSGLSSGIAVMNANGSGRKLLTRGNDSGPAWSPSGALIAFETGAGKKGGIAVVSPSGGGLKQLTHGPDYDPVWSPDGTRLVFDEAVRGSDVLYVIRSDGSGRRRLVGAPHGQGFRDLAWSPDGKWISFTRGPALGRSPHAFDVSLVRPDGTGLRSLTGKLPLANARDIAHGVWKPCS